MCGSTSDDLEGCLICLDWTGENADSTIVTYDHNTTWRDWGFPASVVDITRIPTLNVSRISGGAPDNVPIREISIGIAQS